MRGRPAAPGARLLFEQGFALHRQGRTSEALARYEAALAAHPRHAQALHFSGLLLHQAGRSGEAVTRIERSLRIDDGVPDAWSNAGLIYEALGRSADAVRALERAVALDPSLAEAWSNLASIRLSLDEPVAAENAARRSLAAASSIAGWFNLALALSALRRPHEVLTALTELEARHGRDAGNAAVPGLRAQALVALDRPDEARAVLDLALTAADDPMLRIERARLAETARDEATALADYAAVLRSERTDETTREMALSETIFLLKHWAAWDGLAALQASFRERVARHAERGDASALTPFTFLSDPSTRTEQRAAAEGWAKRHRSGPSTTGAMSSDRPAGGRIKLGYLSADFHDHATGILTAGLFERHDRQRFEVFAYSTGPDDGSALRRRLVAAFDRFVDARGWSDARIAATIAADGIDVLVDLKGHTEHAPTGVMALRPAPIAVSYLGYPGTMGGSFIDYLIGDAIVTPLGEAADYSETLVQLPGCYQVNDDRRIAAETIDRATLGLPDDAVVLCSFNSTYKINPAVFDAWAAILERVPRAVLWLQARGDLASTRERLRRQMKSRGVADGRVLFADNLPHARYLGLYRHADLFLDTWPYNAHTTASDALWSGCPVLTVRGETFAGRVAESVLRFAGFGDGIADDVDDYVARAIRWSNSADLLSGFRQRLEQQCRASPLFDTAATTRALEAAFVAMRDQQVAGGRAPIVISGPS